MKILIIEDDAGLNRGISFALEQERYETFRARSLAEGYKVFESVNPDAVILDLNLPDGDGIAFCGRRLVCHPWIFVFGAGFSVVTVYLSSRKPGRIAGSVSPIEAVRYVDADGIRERTDKKAAKRRKTMALANLGRNRGDATEDVRFVYKGKRLLTQQPFLCYSRGQNARQVWQ